MYKINVLNNLIEFDAIEPANSNSINPNNNCDSNIVSLSQYRERIKRATDKNPLPPCSLAKAA